MKTFTLFILLFVDTCANCQSEQSTLHYKADGIYMVFYDGEKEVNRVPLGKNVNIDYDSFFKSYSIWYTNEEDKLQNVFMKYILIDTKTHLIKMSDKNETMYYVNDINYVKDKGIFFAVLEKLSYGYVVNLEIHNISEK